MQQILYLVKKSIMNLFINKLKNMRVPHNNNGLSKKIHSNKNDCLKKQFKNIIFRPQNYKS